MAQALRLPDLRPISVRMVKHDVLHALKKQIRSQGSFSVRRYGRAVASLSSGLLPSSQATLRPPGPLRTGRESFLSPSSSPSNAS